MKRWSEVILPGIFHNNSNFQLFYGSFGSNYCIFPNFFFFHMDGIYLTLLGNCYLIFLRFSHFYYKEILLAVVFKISMCLFIFKSHPRIHRETTLYKYVNSDSLRLTGTLGRRIQNSFLSTHFVTF